MTAFWSALQEEEKMSEARHENRIEKLISQAASLPETLTAAVEAFEAIRMTARSYQEHKPELLAAFMATADAAVDGREALILAPSLPSDGSAVIAPAVPLNEDVTRAADGLAALAGLLASRLAEAAGIAAQPGDQDALLDAAAAAGRISDLMKRADR